MPSGKESGIIGTSHFVQKGFRTAVLIVFGILSFQIFTIMYFAAPQPFVDEEFHVPQAAHYCAGNFSEWDPKLTTLPGLYAVTLVVWKSIAFFVPSKESCSLWNLRLTNLIISILSIPLFHLLFRDFHRLHNVRVPDWKALFMAVNCAAFPVLYFFSFLYYTDQASTFSVFLMTLLHFRKMKLAAAAAGALAVFIRQTNIIWVAYFALLEVFQSYKVIMNNVMKKSDMRAISADEDIQVLAAPFVSLKQSPTPSNLRRLAGYFGGVIFESIPHVLGYILTMAAFVAFVIINKGIVVGDRSAHQAVLHIPQLLYFALFTAFFASPYLCTPAKLKRFVATCTQRPLTMIFLLKAVVLSVRYYTYVHQYLIADNRHYTFYIWKRLFERDERIKYALAPAYVYSLWAIYDELKPYKFFRTFLFFAVTAIIVIPQKLLEFRYFIVPFLIFRMHVQKMSLRSLALEFSLFLAVNLATFYLFVKKPFVWDHVPDKVQHFMW